MSVLAMTIGEYRPTVYRVEYKRTRTSDCEKSAIDVLKSYKYYRQISKDEFEMLKAEIQAAPHDDAISNIMTKLRKRVYN